MAARIRKRKSSQKKTMCNNKMVNSKQGMIGGSVVSLETQGASKQMPADLKTEWHLAYHNIICLFDGELPYTKMLLVTLSSHQIQILSDKWAKVKFPFVDDKICED